MKKYLNLLTLTGIGLLLSTAPIPQAYAAAAAAETAEDALKYHAAVRVANQVADVHKTTEEDRQGQIEFIVQDLMGNGGRGASGTPGMAFKDSVFYAYDILFSALSLGELAKTDPTFAAAAHEAERNVGTAFAKIGEVYRRTLRKEAEAEVESASASSAEQGGSEKGSGAQAAASGAGAGGEWDEEGAAMGGGSSGKGGSKASDQETQKETIKRAALYAIDLIIGSLDEHIERKDHMGEYLLPILEAFNIDFREYDPKNHGLIHAARNLVQAILEEKNATEAHEQSGTDVDLARLVHAQENVKAMTTKLTEISTEASLRYMEEKRKEAEEEEEREREDEDAAYAASLQAEIDAEGNADAAGVAGEDAAGAGEDAAAAGKDAAGAGGQLPSKAPSAELDLPIKEDGPEAKRPADALADANPTERAAIQQIAEAIGVDASKKPGVLEAYKAQKKAGAKKAQLIKVIKAFLKR